MVHGQGNRLRNWAGGGLLLAVVVLGGLLGGCEFLVKASEKVNGKQVYAQYYGLADKSLAIVVYADPATTFEYPAARAEISEFLASQFRHDMSTVRLLAPKDVVRWQDDTLNWQALPEKEIGKHFGTDRVLYLEIMEYGSREPGSQDLLRGRIKAIVKVFEIDAPGSTPAWEQTFDVRWPEYGPTDVTKTSDLVARKRVLERFSEQVVRCFYDHREYEKSVRERGL